MLISEGLGVGEQQPSQCGHQGQTLKVIGKSYKKEVFEDQFGPEVWFT